MERAQELRADGQRLTAALNAAELAAPDARERKLIADCLDLVRHELGKLDILIARKSRIPEDRVYLSVHSLNKGLLEIGGKWQDTPEASNLVTLLTKKAFKFFQETSPI